MKAWITASLFGSYFASAKVTRVIEKAVACYKELYSKRNKAAGQFSPSTVSSRELKTVNSAALQESSPA
jgi:hypothetical protein